MATCANKAPCLSDAMIEDLTKQEFRDYIKDLSSGKYGIDMKKRKDVDEPAASYRKLNNP